MVGAIQKSSSVILVSSTSYRDLLHIRHCHTLGRLVYNCTYPAFALTSTAQKFFIRHKRYKNVKLAIFSFTVLSEKKKKRHWIKKHCVGKAKYSNSLSRVLSEYLPNIEGCNLTRLQYIGVVLHEMCSNHRRIRMQTIKKRGFLTDLRMRRNMSRVHALIMKRR